MSRKYFQWNLIPRDNPDYCVVHERPDGMGAEDYRLGQGEPTTGVYPEDARIYMSDEESGIELPSFIGNTSSMLLTDHALKDAIAAVCGAKGFEYLPVSIYNHKKRCASDDYFIVNPLGSFDCLDQAKSVVKYLDGQVVNVKKIVIDAKKSEKLPPLFRLQQRPQVYIATDALVRKLVNTSPRPTNVFFTELPIG